jgi:hypothetical protein
MADDTGSQIENPFVHELDSLGSKEDQLNLMLQAWSAEFKADSTNALPAFEALASIVAYRWQSGDAGLSDSGIVPWWAVETLGAGYMKYRDAAIDGRTTKLGEAYGLEGGRQGAPRRIKKFLKERSGRNLALQTAIALEEEFSVEKAIAKVSEQSEVSDRTLWRYWQSFGEQARIALRNFRTAKTSGTDGGD